MNRVWTYIISKELPESTLKELQESGNRFVSGWTAHENKLSAGLEIFGKRIVIVNVNEDVYNASGCSIDKLIRFIKESEAHYNIELLNRFLVAYEKGNSVEVIHSSKIKELLSTGEISENTVVYNTAVSTEAELKDWKQPLKNTWLNKYLTKV